MKNLMMIKKRKIISIILVIIWMIVIFIMSSFTASESSGQSNFIVELIVSIFKFNNIELISLIVRKLAHFIEYFILGLLVFNMIRYYDKSIYIAIMICVLYAISDEIHQLFVVGRSCQIIDMMIDSIGSFSGIILFKLLIKKYKFY